MHCILSIPEYYQVVPQQIIFLEEITSFEFLLDWPKCVFCIFTRIHLVVVAGFKVGSENTLGVISLVAGKDLQTDVEVLHFVVAQCYVDINCLVLP